MQQDQSTKRVKQLEFKGTLKNEQFETFLEFENDQIESEVHHYFSKLITLQNEREYMLSLLSIS
jgi:hypothetical protein